MLWTREMGEIDRSSTLDQYKGAAVRYILTTLGKAVARGLREAGWGGRRALDPCGSGTGPSRMKASKLAYLR